ncbi:MAG: hypothetical protein HY075_16745 [Deltaproteobacteria bacterium]|nr:hypothetical protein [Deltaproteobacteria bacterium]
MENDVIRPYRPRRRTLEHAVPRARQSVAYVVWVPREQAARRRAPSLLLKLLVALLVGAAIALSAPKALADKFNTELSDDVASLGMGTAGINVSRGPYSVFYNPANIAAKDTGSHFQLVNFQFEGTGGYFATTSSGNATNFLNLSSVYGAIKNNPNEFVGGRFTLYPNITLRNLSFGLLYEQNRGAIYRAFDGALRVKARDRLAPTVALSERFASGILRLGASAQLVTVGNADAVIPPAIPADPAFAKVVSSNSGLVLNGGATLTLPVRFLPSFSVVARNIGNTRFSATPLVPFGDLRTEFTQPMTFDWGSSMTFYLGRRLEMKVALDYHDLTNKMDGGRFRHVFMGTELVFYDIIKLRAGLAHGYPSLGFGLNTRKASLDFAAYSDEMDDRLRGAQETRYVLQYTWEIFQ